ncbi:MAG: CHAD domain-containing protein [Salinivirgaceae bacterium]
MDKTLKIVKRFYRDQFDQYFHYLEKIDKNINDGINKVHLHKLRLTIKNIKAVHQFFVMVDMDESVIEKLEKKLNKINKPLGKIRESQLNKAFAQKNLLNFNVQKAYLAYLKTKMVNDLKKLKKNIPFRADSSNSSLITQIKKELHHQDEKVISVQLNSFLLKKVESIDSLLTGIANEQQIHQIRKTLKLIKFRLSLVKYHGIDEIKKFQKDLIKVEQIIGSWHDSIVFRDSLVEFVKENQEFESLVRINLELIEADSLMFQNELPDLIKPVLLELHKGFEKKEPV